MKKFAKVITALVLIMAIMVPVFASAETSNHTMYVNTTNHQRLNMRNSCDYSTNDGIVMTIPYGKPVTFLEMVRHGQWAMIEYNGRVGYVVAHCLTKTNPVVKK